jgi:hypothetical protein
MSIAEIGGISEPVYGKFGIHVIYYMADVPAGEVALEEIRDTVEQNALSDKQNAAYADLIASWIDEMNVEYHMENFGVIQ